MTRCAPFSSRLRARLKGVGLALGLALSAGACHQPEPPVPVEEIPQRLAELGRPNIVFFLIDTLRADELTPYGADPEQSPEVARWARQGIVFERALAQSSWTKVSMASLMTSLWPRSHGVREVSDGLGPGAVTLPELLRDGGYQTRGVQTNGWLAQSFGFQQGFDRYMFPGLSKGPSDLTSSIWAHADNVYTAAIGLLDDVDPSRPFFLYLHFMDVHEYAAPADVRRTTPGRRGAYRASIRWVDEVLARVRAELDLRGLLDRTVLVLASDHGETFGEHGFYGHARDVLSAVLHVPLVIRLPFAVEPVRVPSQVRNLDVTPTLVELAGIPAPEGFEGRSLVPLVTGAEPPVDRPSYASLPTLLFQDAILQESATTGRWTFARNTSKERPGELLFDRQADPDENVNLIELDPTAAESMRSTLDAHLEEPPRAFTAEKDVRIDPGIAQRLRAMGYLQ